MQFKLNILRHTVLEIIYFLYQMSTKLNLAYKNKATIEYRFFKFLYYPLI